ncbi:hypothetical protein, partial [Schleiferilactobacillus shenzhenensis]|uniref:hypothetical protein n=1 Tax=Schleiferilactobacillus shenzhenensis TaxID=1231337 RepID=UPI001C657B87
ESARQSRHPPYFGTGRFVNQCCRDRSQDGLAAYSPEAELNAVAWLSTVSMRWFDRLYSTGRMVLSGFAFILHLEESKTLTKMA